MVGSQVLSVEVFEPWAGNYDTGDEPAQPFGALAITTADRVLAISSQLRFSDLNRPAVGLHTSALDHASWGLLRQRWLQRSEQSGPRDNRWCRYSINDQDQSYTVLPVRPGWKISSIQTMLPVADGLVLNFEGGQEVLLECWPSFDGAIGWNQGGRQKLSKIEVLAPSGEFAWLHPAAPIPIYLDGVRLRSAVFEDWPLALRRTVLQTQLMLDGQPVRRGVQLLSSQDFREPYIQKIQALMRHRFEQHAWANARLINLKNNGFEPCTLMAAAVDKVATI